MQKLSQSQATNGCLTGGFGFCPALSDMLLAGSTAGRTGKKFDDINAVSTANNLHVLRRLHLHLKAKRTLEIGLCFGGSCLLFTSTHQEISGKPTHQHTALDPFQKEVWDDAGLQAVERAGLSGYLDFRPEFSSVALPRLFENRERFDLIYVDGSHIFEDVFVDAYFSGRLLSENGVVAFDDCRDPHVQKVIKFLRASLKSSLREMDLSAFRPDQGKSFKYKLARLAGQTQMIAFQRVGAVSRPWNASFNDF